MTNALARGCFSDIFLRPANLIQYQHLVGGGWRLAVGRPPIGLEGKAQQSVPKWIALVCQ